MLKLIKQFLGSQKSKSKSNIKTSQYPEEYLNIYSKVAPYTMTSIERVIALIEATEYIQKFGLIGDFVECGVWKGGSIMTMILTLQNLGMESRGIWLFDTFDGMTEPKPLDIKFDNTTASEILNNDSERKSNVWAVSKLDEVIQNVFSLSYPKRLIKFVKGPVEETLLKESPDKIALLRLDTDWYDSTKAELEILFPKLVKGGILIIDDYGHWKGCKLAVDEYFTQIKKPIFLHRIDYSGRLMIKTWDD